MKTSFCSHLKLLAAFVAGAACAVSVNVLTADEATPLQSYDTYKQLLESVPVLLDEGHAQTTKDVIDRSVVAFLRRDAEASVAELSEDYSWNKITKDGAAQLASGLETVLLMTKNLYEGNFFESYLGLHSTPIAIIGNLGVQYEVERWLNEDGSMRVLRTLAIYEIKDGKLWRLWAFQPFLGDGPGG